MAEHIIRVPEQIRMGSGAFEFTGSLALSFGRKALIVSDPTIVKLGITEQCQALLKNTGMEVVVFSEIAQEPTLREVELGLSLCHENNCDVIVAVGGGSCLDTAKAIAVMAVNEGSIGDYRYKPFALQGLPLIAVPTTAGTGSEVTSVTVITDPVSEVKMMVKRPELLPKVAIVDPLLTLSCPPSVTAATGLDALCHAIESLLSSEANAVTDAWAKEAIVRISKYLTTAYKNGNDMVARENMAIASMMAGLAFSNASVTLIHGMSRPIGAKFHVPHGISNAMLLPAVMEFTLPHARPAIEQLAPLLLDDAVLKEKALWAELAIEALKELAFKLAVPNLRDWGIEETVFRKFVPMMVTDALASGSPSRHPYQASQEEMEKLYWRCYHYENRRY
jgi:alcohol dehydrogenase class IV